MAYKSGPPLPFGWSCSGTSKRFGPNLSDGRGLADVWAGAACC
jgi:hypothetical protein